MSTPSREEVDRRLRAAVELAATVGALREVVQHAFDAVETDDHLASVCEGIGMTARVTADELDQIAQLAKRTALSMARSREMAAANERLEIEQGDRDPSERTYTDPDGRTI